MIGSKDKHIKINTKVKLKFNSLSHGSRKKEYMKTIVITNQVKQIMFTPENNSEREAQDELFKKEN